mgnify:FL=1
MKMRWRRRRKKSQSLGVPVLPSKSSYDLLHNTRKKSRTTALVVNIYLGFVNLDTYLDYELDYTRKPRVTCQIKL